MHLTNSLAFLASVALQIVMLTLLPLTRGYTRFWPTLGAILSINVAIFLLARLVANGAQLSLLIPISATLIPMSIIVIGVLVYGEAASLERIALLLFATALIGIASRLK
jgi:multidrug transporter EmrE-like cation transporter